MKTSFHASLTNAGFSTVLGVVSAWLDTDDFKIQDRFAGMEIVHEADGVYLFCQESLPARAGSPSFLLEGTIDASPEVAVEWLRPLRRLCETRGVELQLEYVAVDDNGQQVGDEISLP